MTFELARVEFRIVVIDRDADGAICGERPIAEGAVFPSALDRFPDEVRAAVEKTTDAAARRPDA